MRNLKRALSLAMASVMLLGMMVVGTSAKGMNDFSDAAEIANQDAVAVTSEIGIFDGYDDGEFKPENVVTRAEMAVIICKMLYGADVKVDQFTETKVFTDVPAWAEGYVNLCASLGIVAGVGDNKFDPMATVTTAQAAMMLTKALGYFQSARDFGDNWMLAATAKATELGLYGDLRLSAVAGLTRENVAVMVFNALTKAVPVQYNELLGVYYNENKGIMYSLTFYYTDTLGYKNFDLVYRSDETTIYGRPGTTWGIGSYRGNSATTEGNDAYGLNEDGSLKPNMVKMLAADEIITVADTPDYVYTAGTAAKTIYKDLGKGVADKNTDYAWTYFVDGREVDGEKPTNVSDNYGFTANGATTEIYVDSVNEEVTVVEINYYLAEVAKTKDDYAVLNVFEYTGPKYNAKFTTEDLAEGDFVIVTIDCADHFAAGNAVDAFIATAETPETAQGVVTLVNKLENSQDVYLKMDGVKYTYSDNNYGNVETGNEAHPALENEHVLYLDPNGFMVGFKPVSDNTKQYLYVEKAHKALDVQARVIFSDGKSETITANDKLKGADVALNEAGAEALAGHAFAYTVNSKGIYTLEAIHDTDTADHEPANLPEGTESTLQIENGEPYIFGTDNKYLIDLDTVFVDVNDGKVYVGYNEVPNYLKAEMIIIGEGRAKDVVFILAGEKYDENSTLFYIKDLTVDGFDTLRNGKDGDYYRLYKTAFVDGLPEDIYVESSEARDVITAENGHLYQVKKTTADGKYITEVEPVTLNYSDEITTLANGSFWVTDANDNEKKWTFDAETVWVYVDEDGDVSRGSKKDVIVDGTDDELETFITVLKPDDRYAGLVYVIASKAEKVENIIDGSNGYAVIQSLTPSNLTGVINVVAPKTYSDAKLVEMAVAALEKAGYDYKYQNNDGSLVAMMGDRIYTFTMNVTKLDKVTFAENDANVEIKGDKSCYVVTGTKITLVLQNKGNWLNQGEGKYTVSGATGFTVDKVVTRGTVMTINMTADAAVTSDTILNLTWSAI